MNFGFSRLMACENHSTCSSHGQCYNGTCVCEVQFTGINCSQTNLGYTAAFGVIFSLLFLIAVIQLTICIYAEYKKSKHPTVCCAFRLTTQKLLLGVVIAASSTRILYFSLQGIIPEEWLIPMESAYHPLLITGLSLVVCYWSEAFFLETVNVDASRKARFLSKSAVAFAVFNIIIYVILTAHFVATGVGCYRPGSEELWLNGAFQASFGIVLFVVYVIFLTIGVEIFFKLKGAFAIDGSVSQTANSHNEIVNTKEIFKSRLALIFQALLTFLTIFCIIFDATGNLWKHKVNYRTRSIHEIMYRIAEAGTVLWFPCVLWNTSCPEKLWFLNPRCLLKLTGDAGERLLSATSMEGGGLLKRNIKPKNYNTFVQTSSNAESFSQEEGECWICYDRDNADAGGLISPCNCKGGMAQVHHNCLRTWLVQHSQVENVYCKVCKQKYKVEQKKINFVEMLKNSKRSVMIVPAVVIAVSAPCTSVLVFMLCNTLETFAKVLVIGVTVLLELAAFKFLGINFSKLYQVTRVSALRILNQTTASPKQPSDDITTQDATIVNWNEAGHNNEIIGS